jgi:hypothetical protein
MPFSDKLIQFHSVEVCLIQPRLILQARYAREVNSDGYVDDYAYVNGLLEYVRRFRQNRNRVPATPRFPSLIRS